MAHGPEDHPVAPLLLSFELNPLLLRLETRTGVVVRCATAAKLNGPRQRGELATEGRPVTPVAVQALVSQPENALTQVDFACATAAKLEGGPTRGEVMHAAEDRPVAPLMLSPLYLSVTTC